MGTSGGAPWRGEVALHFEEFGGVGSQFFEDGHEAIFFELDGEEAAGDAAGLGDGGLDEAADALDLAESLTPRSSSLSASEAVMRPMPASC